MVKKVLVKKTNLSPNVSPSLWKHLRNDKFESNSLYFYTLTSSNASDPAIQTSIVHSGEYAVEMVIPDTVASKTSYFDGMLPVATTYPAITYQIVEPLYVRIYFYLSADFTLASSSYFGIIRLMGANAERAIVRILRSGTNLIVSSDQGIGNGSTPITREVWHCLEVKYRYGTGSGDGELTVWLDGTQEISSTTLSLAGVVDKVRVGIATAMGSGSYGTLYIDDFAFNSSSIGQTDPEVYLVHPDFRTRVGATVKAIITGRAVGDTVSATFDGATIYGPTAAAGVHNIPVNLLGISLASHTLIVYLKNSGGITRVSTTYRYTKGYAGDPVFSIDEDNNFVKVSGGVATKFFPITDFGNSGANAASWIISGYINMHLGMFSNDTATWLAALASVYAVSNSLSGGPVTINDPYSDSIISNFLAVCDASAGMAFWSWKDEPLDGHYTSVDVKRWWDLIHAANSSHPMAMTNQAGDWLDVGRKPKTQDIMWPRLVCDIYTHDRYPIEDDAGDFTNMLLATDRMISNTLGIVPSMAFVQTADVRPGLGGIPSGAQIKAMVWALIAHGIKGINWYHWQGAVGGEQFTAMSDTVTRITSLTNAIYGVTGPVTSSSNSNIHLISKTYGGNHYVFCVNITNSSQNGVVLTVSGLPGSTEVTVEGESRTVTSGVGTITDDFDAYAIHIYYWPI